MPDKGPHSLHLIFSRQCRHTHTICGTRHPSVNGLHGRRMADSSLASATQARGSLPLPVMRHAAKTGPEPQRRPLEEAPSSLFSPQRTRLDSGLCSGCCPPQPPTASRGASTNHAAAKKRKPAYAAAHDFFSSTIVTTSHHHHHQNQAAPHQETALHHSPPPPRLGPAHTHLSVASFLSFTRRSGAIPLGCWRITHCRALWLGSAEAIGAGSLLEDCPTRPTRPARQGTRQSDSLSNGPIPRRGRTKATSTVARTHCSPRHETHARQRKHARPPPPPVPVAPPCHEAPPTMRARRKSHGVASNGTRRCPAHLNETAPMARPVQLLARPALVT